MSFDRRQFLATAIAAAALPRVGLAGAQVLRAEPVVAQILDPGDGTTPMFGFNGSTPGPELRLREGERLSVAFENRLPDPTAVHWHGIRIDNAMDGVPGLTQDPVGVSEEFAYDFVAPDAGTYWYHSHHQSWEQVARGLYGPLIVEEATPPDVDRDITVIVDDWRLEQSGELMGGFGNMHDFAHGGRVGNFAKVILSESQVHRGERIRLRLINTATARIFPVALEGIDARIVALDGRPLATPREAEQMVLAPAQRIDLIGDVTEAVRFLFPTRSESFEMGRLELTGDEVTADRDPVTALPAGYRPDPGPDPRPLRLRMQGGAMGGRHTGDDIWAFNGVSGMTDDPYASFALGETVRISLINDTAFPHGMHLHGHHFYEMEDDTPGDLRDTTLVMPDQRRDILCVFDNPGKWLFHCHMLGHQASGMKTWVEVA